MWPKDYEGKWIEPMDPKFDGEWAAPTTTTRTMVTRTRWDVQQDFYGLIALMGGTGKAEGSRISSSASRWGDRNINFKRSFPIQHPWWASSRWE